MKIKVASLRLTRTRRNTPSWSDFRMYDPRSSPSANLTAVGYLKCTWSIWRKQMSELREYMATLIQKCSTSYQTERTLVFILSRWCWSPSGKERSGISLFVSPTACHCVRCHPDLVVTDTDLTQEIYRIVVECRLSASATPSSEIRFFSGRIVFGIIVFSFS